jgi:glycerol uptake facilitator-like aquaporin
VVIMKAISMSPGSGQRTASGSAVVFLHGHQLEGNVARAAALGATAPAAGVSAGRVPAAEAVVTFVLVLVVVAVATDSRVPRGIAAMAIDAALASAIVISGPVSGAGVNPARAIGPMILAG